MFRRLGEDMKIGRKGREIVINVQLPTMSSIFLINLIRYCINNRKNLKITYLCLKYWILKLYVGCVERERAAIVVYIGRDR